MIKNLLQSSISLNALVDDLKQNKISIHQLTKGFKLNIVHHNNDANLNYLIFHLNQLDIIKLEIFENMENCKTHIDYGLKIEHSNGFIIIDTYWTMQNIKSTNSLIKGLLAPIYLTALYDKLYFNGSLVGNVTTTKAFEAIRENSQANCIDPIYASIDVPLLMGNSFRVYFNNKDKFNDLSSSNISNLLDLACLND